MPKTQHHNLLFLPVCLPAAEVCAKLLISDNRGTTTITAVRGREGAIMMLLSTRYRPAHSNTSVRLLLGPCRCLRPLPMITMTMMVMVTLMMMPSWAVAHSSDDNFDAVAETFATIVSNSRSHNVGEHQHHVNSTNITPMMTLRRAKRFLEFPKAARMSWRLNIKNNFWKINTINSYGLGFRTNYAYPEPKEQRKKNRFLFKRDLFNHLEYAIDGHGFDGRACLLKLFCAAQFNVDKGQNTGMLYKILKVIFSLEERERKHLPYLRTSNCQQILHSHCPFSFDSISPYTDDM